MTRKFVIPGERLFKLDSEHVSGAGTYTVHEYIYSSVAGQVDLAPSDKDPGTKIVQVQRQLKTKHNVPFVGAIVTCKITQTTLRYAKCSILCVEDTILPHPYTGMIRREDMRSKDRDLTVVFECFKINDIVLARVVSLADMLSCVLSTAEENLGVVYGRCPNSENLPHKMIAQNFNDLVCKECHVRENRKIAKIPQNLNEK